MRGRSSLLGGFQPSLGGRYYRLEDASLFVNGVCHQWGSCSKPVRGCLVLADMLIEPLVEFFQAEKMLLSAIMLDGEGGAYTSHHSTLFNALALDQPPDQSRPVGVAGPSGVFD